MTSGSPDAQNSLFNDPSSSALFTRQDELPEDLRPAGGRLQFTPSYLVVGFYRLLNDPSLRVPAWEKCRNGTMRGLMVGSVWAVTSYFIQKQFVRLFVSLTPNIVGISSNSIMGFRIPVTIQTFYTWNLILSQVTMVLWYFLSRNIRIARSRVFAQTVTSRAKGANFFQPYVEEYTAPPILDPEDRSISERIAASGWLGRLFIKRVILAPLALYPVVGMCISAYLKSVSTSRNLHRDYFLMKQMTPAQCARWIEERKWEYRVFGFFAALLEGLPIIGLLFSVSNRVGAAMWAFDLEKRQHFVADQHRLKST